MLMGPIMIHQQKKIESYLFFASSLESLDPSLKMYELGKGMEKKRSAKPFICIVKAILTLI